VPNLANTNQIENPRRFSEYKRNQQLIIHGVVLTLFFRYFIIQ